MIYRRITTYFFTGTGNSMRMASWLGDIARAGGLETLVSPLRDANPKQAAGCADRFPGEASPY